MGWYGMSSCQCIKNRRGSINRKASVDEEFTSDKGIVIMSTMRGVIWYGIYMPLNGSRPYGLVCRTRIEGDEFWYKPLDETMGPIFYDMPKKYLDYLDVHAPLNPDNKFDRYAFEWRSKCRRHNEEKRQERAARRARRTAIDDRWHDKHLDY